MVNLLFDHVIPKLFQTSFSKDLIGSDKTNWISRKVSFNMTPKAYIDFLIATHWEELSSNICILQNRPERWQSISYVGYVFLLLDCWYMRNNWALLSQLMQNSATLAIKGQEREKWGQKGNIGRRVLWIALFVYFLFWKFNGKNLLL